MSLDSEDYSGHAEMVWGVYSFAFVLFFFLRCGNGIYQGKKSNETDWNSIKYFLRVAMYAFSKDMYLVLPNFYLKSKRGFLLKNNLGFGFF